MAEQCVDTELISRTACLRIVNVPLAINSSVTNQKVHVFHAQLAPSKLALLTLSPALIVSWGNIRPGRAPLLVCNVQASHLPSLLKARAFNHVSVSLDSVVHRVALALFARSANTPLLWAAVPV